MSMVTDKPFLYGTHYSTPAYVLFYLVRTAPELMLKLQNGRFDKADRLFDSISDTWFNVFTNPSDVKELIPEFYQTHEFLTNKYCIDFGSKQNGEIVNDVKLPPWATSPEDFININLKALEGDYVSSNIHKWIDLIFGYKQTGEEALAADNLFYYLTYQRNFEENIYDSNYRQALETQRREFGQTPKQIFFEPHPEKKDFQVDLQKVEVFNNFSLKLTLESTIEKLHRKPISCIGLSSDSILTCSHDGSSKMLLIKDKSIQRCITPSQLALSSCCFDIGNILLGSWDNNIYYYSIQTAKCLDILRAHNDAVTSIIQYQELLFSASWDSTIKIWQKRNSGYFSVSVE
eukprot:TRINITY_DN1659_c0_g1_i3.p1 TRINITY_DN1659_c0_g1~~TRINITY_DN1659_c0_g1_i3.p1  ORF type:complete len:346 (+),score=73.74 TRINITY_DN1659_c0_g1_i3:146-1183(+)